MLIVDESSNTNENVPSDGATLKMKARQETEE